MSDNTNSNTNSNTDIWDLEPSSHPPMLDTLLGVIVIVSDLFIILRMHLRLLSTLSSPSPSPPPSLSLFKYQSIPPE
jgi:hypothetical protein